MTKYIVTYRFNDKVIDSKWDSLTEATIEQLRLDSFGIISIIHLISED